MASQFSVLVTGANSGLGFAICCRLIDEFPFMKSRKDSLRIIITTRDQTKADDTVKRLSDHLAFAVKRAADFKAGLERSLENRVTFQQEIVDLTSLRSVKKLGSELLAERRPIDVLILNAGIGGWIGLNWPLAVWSVTTDWVHSVTYPPFKIAAVGSLTKPQLISPSTDEPPLGEVFCANVFGHYMLVHYLSSLLSGSTTSNSPGRIVWVSTLEGNTASFSIGDLQGIQSDIPYESSKRLTDALAISSRLPSSMPWLKSFHSPSKSATMRQEKQDLKAKAGPDPDIVLPKHYVSQPGIAATSIFVLPYVLELAFIFALYVARMLGSIWHTITPYKGACAPVWLALADQAMLDELEERDGPGKWGSATDRWGDERVERTEIDGWGYGGKVGDDQPKNGKRRRGRRRGAQHLTNETKEQFEDLGRSCWKEMEGLRIEWEQRLDSEP